VAPFSIPPRIVHRGDSGKVTVFLSDPKDEYLTGKNNADYYDTRDDEVWSEDGDFDDDDDWR